MIGTTSLGQLVTNLRYEVGASDQPAAGINMRSQLVYVLNRAQEEIWADWEWPGLTADRDIYISVGTRYYAYPSDMPFEQIERAWLVWNTLYGELAYGIGPNEFALFNSNTGFTSFPVQRWMHNADTNLFELWPIPSEAPPATATSQAALIRFRGTKSIPAMVADSDMSTFPSTAVVLYAAAELLARNEDAQAGLKLQKAQEYLRRLKVRSNKTEPFVMGGGRRSDIGQRIGLDYIPMGYGSGPGA